MKTFICLSVAIGALAGPALSFVEETNAPLTRAQVRADLVRVEQAGYQPQTDDVHYPANIQAAEAKIASQDAARITNSAIGGTASNGSTQSGAAASGTQIRSLYVGH